MAEQGGQSRDVNAQSLRTPPRPGGAKKSWVGWVSLFCALDFSRDPPASPRETDNVHRAFVAVVDTLFPAMHNRKCGLYCITDIVLHLDAIMAAMNVGLHPHKWTVSVDDFRG